MSLQPSVTLVCLVADRDEMLERAIRCWRAQGYPCNLLVYDNGYLAFTKGGLTGVDYVYRTRNNRTIGELRNAANALVTTDIIAHWDSDDWSHPRRIEEQVAMLQSSGADCVGYREALFWDTRPCRYHLDNPSAVCTTCGAIDNAYCSNAFHLECRCNGEAWIYRHDKPNYAIGASLCYWRKTWESVPFKPLTIGEDSAWIWDVQVAGGKVVGTGSIKADCACSYDNKAICGAHELDALYPPEFEPRMICRIHGNNTSNCYSHAAMHGERAKDYWTRTPEWDGYCKEVCG